MQRFADYIVIRLVDLKQTAHIPLLRGMVEEHALIIIIQIILQSCIVSIVPDGVEF